jgi:hypothetical protein
MAPLVDIMLANDTNKLVYAAFDARYRELDKKMDEALLACSHAVSLPATKVVWEYSLADLAWGFCEQEKCDQALIARHVRAGNLLAYKVKNQIESTT